MKACVPTLGERGLDEKIGEHFGRVPYYAVYDSETEEVTVMPNISGHAGGQGYPAEILAKAGIDVMLCDSLGRRAIMMFQDFGIMVYVGAKGTVKDAIEAWKNDKLTAATDENACAQHKYRGDGIGEKHGEHEHHH